MTFRPTAAVLQHITVDEQTPVINVITAPNAESLWIFFEDELKDFAPLDLTTDRSLRCTRHTNPWKRHTSNEQWRECNWGFTSHNQTAVKVGPASIAFSSNGSAETLVQQTSLLNPGPWSIISYDSATGFVFSYTFEHGATTTGVYVLANTENGKKLLQPIDSLVSALLKPPRLEPSHSPEFVPLSLSIQEPSFDGVFSKVQLANMQPFIYGAKRPRPSVTKLDLPSTEMPMPIQLNDPPPAPVEVVQQARPLFDHASSDVLVWQWIEEAAGLFFQGDNSWELAQTKAQQLPEAADLTLRFFSCYLLNRAINIIVDTAGTRPVGKVVYAGVNIETVMQTVAPTGSVLADSRWVNTRSQFVRQLTSVLDIDPKTRLQAATEGLGGVMLAFACAGGPQSALKDLRWHFDRFCSNTTDTPAISTTVSGLEE